MPDDIWNEAATHDHEQQLAALPSMIGLTNLFNRFNAVKKPIAGGLASAREHGHHPVAFTTRAEARVV